jgi:hypothetical protein
VCGRTRWFCVFGGSAVCAPFSMHCFVLTPFSLASCVLFGMLSKVRRPFEAHVLKHGYRSPGETQSPPQMSRRPSPTRTNSPLSEKFRHRVSISSTRRSTPSNLSDTDFNPLSLRANSQPSTIHAPAPIRSIGMGFFTSDAQPPPLPALLSRRSTSIETPPPLFHPTHGHIPVPPRMSSFVSTSGFVPLSIPIQYSASAWRAVHPILPSPLGPAGNTSRSYPGLPHKQQGYAGSYRSIRHSRSAISLTRPYRLSTATPSGSVGWTTQTIRPLRMPSRTRF